jgi:hypothetical protein
MIFSLAADQVAAVVQGDSFEVTHKEILVMDPSWINFKKMVGSTGHQ